MEITVFPRAFTVAPATAPTQGGETVDVMVVTFQDAGGTVVKVMFGEQDWPGFQGFVADYEAAARAAKARMVLLGPGGRAPTLRERKH